MYAKGVCGIGGVVARGRAPVDPADLRGFVRALRHRGPDGEGVWRSTTGDIGLSHTRLAIIDLDERSAQPMIGDDGSVISFNGEIYNYRQLRAELMQLGIVFRTTSDTEVVLAAYRCWGPRALERLRGMFALALAVPDEHRVFLARDPFGIKPLYITANDAYIRFASEVRALQPFGDGSISTDALIDLFTWGNIAAPLTFYSSIIALEPGHYAYVDAAGVHDVCWSPGTAVLDGGNDTGTESSAVEAIRESTRFHLESDVEVGLFLSSGVDSSVLASIAAETSSRPLRTITVRNPDHDESIAAARFAASIAAEHVTVDFADSDMRSELDNAVGALDQPSLDGINSYFVARAAQQAGLKVAISGVGGDELFGGYGSFARLSHLDRLRSCSHLLPRLPRSSDPVASPTIWSRSSAIGRFNWLSHYWRHDWGRYLIARGVMAPHEVAQLIDEPIETVLGRIQRRLGPTLVYTGSNTVTHLEVQQYLQTQLLRDIDAVSMQSSIEVRTPLVDACLYQSIAPLPSRLRVGDPTKPVLRSAAMHALPTFPRTKRGFTVPIESWMRDHVADRRELLPTVLERATTDRVIDQALTVQRPWTHGWLVYVLATYTSSICQPAGTVGPS